MIFIALGVFTFFPPIGRVKMSPQINIPEFPDNVFLINAEGCKIPKLDPYDPLIKAHLNIGTELKCEVQEDLVYCVNGTIFINWEVVNISLPTLAYCKYDLIWRPPYGG
jgi:hypothetical protein